MTLDCENNKSPVEKLGISSCGKKPTRDVRLNFIISGELAQFLQDMRMRGRIISFTEGVLRGLSLLQAEELRLRMIRARLDNEGRE